MAGRPRKPTQQTAQATGQQPDPASPVSIEQAPRQEEASAQISTYPEHRAILGVCAWLALHFADRMVDLGRVETVRASLRQGKTILAWQQLIPLIEEANGASLVTPSNNP